jgi:transcriptional regulator with XRE-family HTH domain
MKIEKKVVLLQRKSQYIGIMDLKEIGQIIRERRAELGVNQRTVSELSGVVVNTLVAIEHGKGNPQITTLLDILDTIGLQLEVKPKVMEYETR